MSDATLPLMMRQVLQTRNWWALVMSVTDCKTRWRTIRDSYKKNKKKMKAASRTGSSAYPKSKYNSENLTFLDGSCKGRTTLSRFDQLNFQHEGDDCEEDKESRNKQQLQETTEDVRLGNVDGRVVVTHVKVETEGGCAAGTGEHITPERDTLSLPDPQETRKRPKLIRERKEEEIRKEREERGRNLKDFVGRHASMVPEHPVETFFRSMAMTVMQFPPHLIAETRMQVCHIVSDIELRALKEQPRGQASHVSQLEWFPPGTDPTSHMDQNRSDPFVQPSAEVSNGSSSSSPWSDEDGSTDGYDVPTY